VSGLHAERALEATLSLPLGFITPTDSSAPLYLHLPGRTSLMMLACQAVGLVSVLLPYVLAGPWIAQHGQMNYMDALAETAENQSSMLLWHGELLRCAAGLISLVLAFRYVSITDVLPFRSLGDILPFKPWVFPLLLLVYATPTAAIAGSLWTHLCHARSRLEAPDPPDRPQPTLNVSRDASPTTSPPPAHAAVAAASTQLPWTGVSRPAKAAAAAAESDAAGPRLPSAPPFMRSRQVSGMI
jgi:hypothetical protein